MARLQGGEASPSGSGGQILLNSQRPEMGKLSGVLHLIVVIRQNRITGTAFPAPWIKTIVVVQMKRQNVLIWLCTR